MKETIKSLRYSKRRSLRSAFFAMRAVWKPMQLLVDARFRSLVLLKYFGGDGVHQVSNMTWPDRYPDVFTASARLLEWVEQPRLLSFGCSTGEEVFSLRKYFPAAYILGVDINKWNLAKCRHWARAEPDASIEFGFSEKTLLAARAPFDAIFCMSVLQRPENRRPGNQNSTDHYPFEKFDSELSQLDSYLRPNGLMVLDCADYRFADASIAEHYTAIPGDHAITRPRPVYSRDNRKLADSTYSERIYRKDR